MRTPFALLLALAAGCSDPSMTPAGDGGSDGGTIDPRCAAESGPGTRSAIYVSGGCSSLCLDEPAWETCLPTTQVCATRLDTDTNCGTCGLGCLGGQHCTDLGRGDAARPIAASRRYVCR